ncbi:MAG TPA: hypothetical protein VK179_13800 [Bacteroidales bacterium]|nr:hypothetical protein [Bacteroidales bacterium]
MNSIIFLDDAYKDAVKNYLFPIIIKHTVQIFKNGNPWASGVLFKNSKGFYIITSGHILDMEEKHNLSLLIGNELLPFEGRAEWIDPNKGQINDWVDILFLKLNEFYIQKIEVNKEFITTNNLFFNHIPSSVPLKYLIIGFPITYIKHRKTRPLCYPTSIVPQSNFVRLNFSPEINILISYKKRKAFGFEDKGYKMLPNPEGLSGSGLWYIPTLYKDIKEKIPYGLVGIMNDQRLEDNIVSATKIDIINDQFHLT